MTNYTDTCWFATYNVAGLTKMKKMGFTRYKTEQPLWGMELQKKKEVQKD